MSPTDVSFDSAVSSSPVQVTGRPRPSVVPKPPSPLSNNLELSGDSSIEHEHGEDSNEQSGTSMEVDA